MNAARQMFVSLAGLVLLMGCRSGASDTSPDVRFELRTEPTRGRLTVLEDSAPVLTYNFGDQLAEGAPVALTRSCYVHPIFGLDGEVLTDDFPRDHLHHRGLSLMWPRMRSGQEAVDQWHIKGLRTVFDALVETRITTDAAFLEVRNFWVLSDGTRVARELLSLTVHRRDAVGRFVEVEFEIEVLARDLVLQGQVEKGYGGLNLRFASRQDTTLTTAEGRLKSDADHEPLSWADLSARFADREQFSGIAIQVLPDHPDAPPPWTLRHYGDLNVAWPGVESRSFDPGSVLRLGYRLWIHRGDADEGQVVERLEQEWTRSVGPGPHQG